MIKVNLLSPEKKEIAGVKGEARGLEEREKKLHSGAAVAAAIITVGAIAYLYITQSDTINQRRKTLQEYQARKLQLESVLKAVTELEKTKGLLEKKVKLISDLKNQQEDAVRMMDELSNSLPEWVWLTNLNFTNRNLIIKGRTIHNNLISDFINNLRGTGVFLNINFLGSQRQVQDNVDFFNFTLTCGYKPKEMGKPSPPSEPAKSGKTNKDKKAG